MGKKIIIASHIEIIWQNHHCAIFQNLKSNLTEKGNDFITISHCMNTPQKSFLYNSELNASSKIWLKINIWVIRYFYEMILNLLYIYKSSKKNKITYIWIDPLNALSWLIGKKMNLVERNIFYTPDYSPGKFKNPVINRIYHWVDRVCAKNADEVWNVSKRIHKIRRKMWVQGSKNLFIPNVPWKVSVNKKGQRKKFDLITSGTLNVHLEYKNIISSITELKEKFPEIRLLIAWDWELRWEILNFIKKKKLHKHVFLLGFLETQTYLQKVSECWIWIAMYNGKWAFNYYWDSTKCREFMYFWLPILTSSFHSTAEEIQSTKSGIIDDEMSVKNYCKNIETLFTHYHDYAKASLKAWQENNKIYTKTIWSL